MTDYASEALGSYQLRSKIYFLYGVRWRILSNHRVNAVDVKVKTPFVKIAVASRMASFVPAAVLHKQIAAKTFAPPSLRTLFLQHLDLLHPQMIL